MAILTDAERTWLRNQVERAAVRKGVEPHWLKDQLEAAAQAIEDRWDAAGTQTAISNDIEGAAPGVFSAAEKKYVAAFWLIMRGRREEANI